MPNNVIIEKRTVLTNNPGCLASFHAFHEECNQNGWASKFSIRPNCGYFSDVAICAAIVNVGNAICVAVCSIFL